MLYVYLKTYFPNLRYNSNGKDTVAISPESPLKQFLPVDER